MTRKYTCACSADGAYCDEEGWREATYPPGSAWATDNPYTNLAEALCRAPAAERDRVLAWMDAKPAAPRVPVIEGILGYARPT